MSDFDKEAEREKLREKYGKEEEKRKATEQMSELLLKGATMTNAHCTDCGDPIFRYDGQEFCPTCQKPVARDQGESDEDVDDQADHIEVADPSDEATVQFGDGADEQSANGAPKTADGTGANGDAETADGTGANGDAETADRTAPNGDADAANTSTDAAGQPPAAGSTGDTPREIPSADPDRTPGASRPTEADAGSEQTAPAPDSPTPGQRAARGAEDSVTAELSAAESRLAETVHRFAQRAADTDDPRTAREHLKAAREAAEALDAVRF
ncbi:Sjogren's syndrome/scleroderma autoantigen 1 family protein [Haloarcula rara]|uniref:Sjogren's syndrome/scleroderma autoantigen 1 family protein n=1 Tax=Haloarcula rara TaxID=3033387 RepID=UPI0023E76BD7|nr:Sjogren's syndrome/scleroderma autoantigen 1 family protein [Halomicroarcula sp. SHR3]